MYVIHVCYTLINNGNTYLLNQRTEWNSATSSFEKAMIDKLYMK